jgi:hypothetical protein
MTRMTHFIKVLSMLEFVIPTKMKSLFFYFWEDIPLCQQSNAFYQRTDAPCRINLISEKNYHFLDPSKGCYVLKIEPHDPPE